MVEVASNFHCKIIARMARVLTYICLCKDEHNRVNDGLDFDRLGTHRLLFNTRHLLIVCLELNIEAKSEVDFFGDHFTKSQNVVGCFPDNNN